MKRQPMRRLLPMLRVAALALTLPAAGESARLQADTGGGNVDWRVYEGDNAASHYSPLTQINRRTVNRLEVAWTYPLSAPAVLNPLIVDGVMYIIGNKDRLIALDAATGRTLWASEARSPGRVRGLTYWESADRSDQRILYTHGHALSAIDARTGRQIAGFGTQGDVDLRAGLGRPFDQVPRIASSSPGRIFGNLIIVGSSTGEDYGSPPGDIRAYDVRTGKMAWIFHTVPHPGEPGAEGWRPDAASFAGGANDWGGMSIDERRGIVYVPLGGPTYDFFGGDRPGDNLYGNSLVALDACTGKKLWHFQTVHHDLWDYDLAASPTLLTVRHRGKPIDIVAQASKNGFLYVFDRVSGKPLWPIVERPVPQSRVPGEHSSPTQPFPTVVPPFARQGLGVDDLDPALDKTEYEAVKAQLLAARNEGLFTPPEIDRNWVQSPGPAGGANWGSTGADPRTGRFYVQAFNVPTVARLIPIPATEPARPGETLSGEAIFKANCQLCHGADREGGPGSPELKSVASRHPLDEIKQIITGGRAMMPAFGGKLSPADIDRVAAFLAGGARPPLPEKIAPPEGFGMAGAVATVPLPPMQRYTTPYGNYLLQKKGVPAIRAPWTSLTAYDLSKPRILWQIPIGSVPSYGMQPTGTGLSTGGLLITAGGLIFMSSLYDRKFHAYDKDGGKLLWETSLPADGQGIPATYRVKGRQYIVLAAAQNGLPIKPAPREMSAPTKFAYVVFALPKTGRGQWHD